MNLQKHGLVILTVFTLVCSFSLPSRAAIPDGINFQGNLTNNDGSPVDGVRSMSFAAYNVEVGGTPLWSQAEIVSVDSGIFSVVLGNPVNPFPSDLFDNPVFISVVVDGEALLPRRALKSAPYTYKASDAETLNGFSASSLNQSTHVSDTNNPHSVTAAQTGAATATDLSDLQAQLATAHADITILQSELAGAIATINALQADVAQNTFDIDANSGGLSFVTTALTTAVESINEIEDNSVLELDTILTLSGSDTALFNGVDVQIVNGTGTTDGDPNGKGNLIVGYNEPSSQGGPTCSIGTIPDQINCELIGGTWAFSHQSGSHNVIIGDEHNYSRYGGFVVGSRNSISGINSVAMGYFNSAIGRWSVVSGGSGSVASGDSSSVSGGSVNVAEGLYSSISGGLGGIAQGDESSISGGEAGRTFGDRSSVSGGLRSSATGPHSSVSGGNNNEATGSLASISGGSQNIASGFVSSVTGGSFNTASGSYSTVVGGGGDDPVNEGNTASGPWSVVSGGVDGVASAEGATVSGGIRNTAIARWATVSGGANRDSTGEADWRAGTLFENF